MLNLAGCDKELHGSHEGFAGFRLCKHGNCLPSQFPSLEFKYEINGILYILQMSTLQYRKMDFEEFCAAAISVHQLEGMRSWEQHARTAYELFEKDGNRPIMIEELASVRSFLPLFVVFYKKKWICLLILLSKHRISVNFVHLYA